jgi:hypothetical protein
MMQNIDFNELTVTDADEGSLLLNPSRSSTNVQCFSVKDDFPFPAPAKDI